MTKTKLILILLGILIITVFGSWYIIDAYRVRLEKSETNLKIKSDQWIDKEGRYVAEIDNRNATIKRIKQIHKNDSSRMATEYEKRIYDLKGEMNELGLKYRNLQSYFSAYMAVKDTFKVKFIKKDTTLTATHSDGYMTQNFVLNRDFSMETDYTYKDSLSILDIRRPKLKENGKKHFPNWAWLPWVGWDDKILIHSKNKKATYYGLFSLKIER